MNDLDQVIRILVLLGLFALCAGVVRYRQKCHTLLCRVPACIAAIPCRIRSGLRYLSWLVMLGIGFVVGALGFGGLFLYHWGEALDAPINHVYSEVTNQVLTLQKLHQEQILDVRVLYALLGEPLDARNNQVVYFIEGDYFTEVVTVTLTRPFNLNDEGVNRVVSLKGGLSMNEPIDWGDDYTLSGEALNQHFLESGVPDYVAFDEQSINLYYQWSDNEWQTIEVTELGSVSHDKGTSNQQPQADLMLPVRP